MPLLTHKQKISAISVVFRSQFQLEENENLEFIRLRQEDLQDYNDKLMRYTTPSAPEMSQYTFFAKEQKRTNT